MSKDVLLRIADMLDPLGEKEDIVDNDPELLRRVAEYLDRNDAFMRDFVAPSIGDVYGDEGEVVVKRSFTATPGNSVQESLRELADRLEGTNDRTNA